MAERNLDFDQLTERKNTNSLKYDFAAKRGKPEGLIPLWVADMDFQTSSYIQDALAEQARHGIWGYSEPSESYFQTVKDWMKKRHGWEVEEKWLVKTPGVVFALAMAVKAFTQPGDAVLIQKPVYYPFYEVVADNGRRVVNSPLLEKDGTYQMDFEDLEAKIVNEDVKLLLLCNPHNPVGRAWSREELIRLGDLCLKHNVFVVSDEIHADFVLSGKHNVFMTLKDEYRNITITCTSPGKTFNLAGLQISNIFLPNAVLRRKFRAQINAAGYSQLNTDGLLACEAAYGHGEEWYQAMLAYLKDNIVFVREYLETNIPQVRLVEPEATYLLWLDFRSLQLSEEELENLIIKKAGLWLDRGSMFGEEGKGFERLNAACPRSTLKQALKQLAEAVESL